MNRDRLRAVAHDDAGRLELDTDAGVRSAYDAHGSELFRMAARSLGDRELAEEAVQETFVRAWRAAGRYDPTIGSVRTWLYAIARNVVIDLSRARAARPRLAGHEVEPPVDPDDEFDRAVESWQLREGLARVSAEHRLCLVEVHCRGRTYEDVADELGVPAGTIKSRVYYGLRALRLVLEEMGVSAEDVSDVG